MEKIGFKTMMGFEDAFERGRGGTTNRKLGVTQSEKFLDVK